MKILIHLHTGSELMSFEAISLGFVLASFDHHVQFYLSGDSRDVLSDPTSRLYGMIQSLSLYDIPKAWADFDVPDTLASFFEPLDFDKTDDFDTRLTF
ncbi:MAG: hypothetical protein Q3971_00935 [Moraxella sp.]|nr:hypothetical protein [Moraxella sp.]